MEKSPFDLRPPYFALLPSPVGDFRNGLETPLNFSLNRVIIQRGSGVGLMELKTFTCPPCLGGIFQKLQVARSPFGTNFVFCDIHSIF